MSNVILYSRVSTTDQKEHGHSLRAQKQALYSYCEYSGYNVIGYY